MKYKTHSNFERRVMSGEWCSLINTYIFMSLGWRYNEQAP